MSCHLLALPNEILELILFRVIALPWKNDVKDFLSITSTCRRLREFHSDERYWEIMACRRDPLDRKPLDQSGWFGYCREIYRMRTIRSDELQQKISRFNEEYFCTIEKVVLWPDRIRVYIDERGDNSLGMIQNPASSTLRISNHVAVGDYRDKRLNVIAENFSVADPHRQYLGYLEYSLTLTRDDLEKNLLFQYGFSGYSYAILFRIDQSFLCKYNLSI